MKIRLFVFIFSLIHCAVQAQSPDPTFVDREQVRIDMIDGKEDHHISLGNDDLDIKAAHIYFDIIDSIQATLISGTMPIDTRKNLMVELYLSSRLVTGRSVSFLNYYDKLFNQINSIVRARENNSLQAELYRNPGMSIRVLNYFRDEEITKTFLKDAASWYPDEVLKAYNDYSEKDWAAEVVIHTSKTAPLAIKKYLSVNHPIKNILANSHDAACEDMLQIYKLYGVKSNSYVLLDAIVNDQLSIVQADSLGKYDRYYLKAMLKIRKKRDPLAKYSLDKELELTSLKYVREINELHEVNDPKLRFAMADNLDARELYTLMVYSQDEIFTSTFLGLFDRLMVRMKPLKGDQLLQSVGNNRFRTFIKLNAGFNTLDKFLRTMDVEARNQMLHDFVSNLEVDRGNLSDAVDVADAFGSISDSSSLRVIESTLYSEYQRNDKANMAEGKAIYGLLLTLFKDKATFLKPEYDKVAASYVLPLIDRIPNAALMNDHHQNVQAIFFFDDDDGKASFASFIETFNKPEWSIIRKGMYVEILSKNKKVRIVANTPESEELGGQDAVVAYLDSNGLSPSVIVHRGHSYYAMKTIERIRDQTKIAFMGSCGGYNRLTDIIDHSPEIQIIATKQIGTMLVNNPLLYQLAMQISSGKDIIWQDFWNNLAKTVKGNKAASDRFSDYIPPHKNLGAIFLQAYRKALH